MALRKSVEEVINIHCGLDAAFIKCENALIDGGFTNICKNSVIHQISADYKKLTVWGEIQISLTKETHGINLNIKSTANVDNIYALINSPNKKILSKFKEAIS